MIGRTHVFATTSLMTPAMRAKAIAGRIGLRHAELGFLSVPTDEGWMLRMNSPKSFQVPLPHLSHHGCHLPDTCALKRNPTESLGNTPVVVEALGKLALVVTRVGDAIHPVEFGIFFNCLPLPYSNDKILSGYLEIPRPQEMGLGLPRQFQCHVS